VAQTNKEKNFSYLIMIVAKGLLSYIISFFSIIMQKINQEKQDFQNKLSYANDFLDKY
jgi:hypothetical protein